MLSTKTIIAAVFLSASAAHALAQDTRVILLGTAGLASNGPFLEPDRNMDQQVINQTPDRRKHAARRRVHQVENMTRQ